MKKNSTPSDGGGRFCPYPCHEYSFASVQRTAAFGQEIFILPPLLRCLAPREFMEILKFMGDFM
jgi:hypothetical protein